MTAAAGAAGADGLGRGRSQDLERKLTRWMSLPVEEKSVNAVELTPCTGSLGYMVSGLGGAGDVCGPVGGKCGKAGDTMQRRHHAAVECHAWWARGDGCQLSNWWLNV